MQIQGDNRRSNRRKCKSQDGPRLSARGDTRDVPSPFPPTDLVRTAIRERETNELIITSYLKVRQNYSGV